MNVVPAEIPRMQRVSARGVIAVKAVGAATRLDRLFQEGAAKIRMPARDGGPLEAILINMAGGLTGGDRIAWQVEAGDDASITLTTQACEKVYRASSGHAEAACAIRAGARARVAWLPQETIVYDRSAFMRRLDVDLADDASALLLEATVFGRQAMGEAVAAAVFRDRWRVRQGGRLVHCEDFAIAGDVAAALSRSAVGDGARAMATLLFVDPQAEGRLDAARAVIGDAGGASAWRVGGTGKLLARLTAADSRALRQRLMPLVGLLNGRAGLPRIWSS